MPPLTFASPINVRIAAARAGLCLIFEPFAGYVWQWEQSIEIAG